MISESQTNTINKNGTGSFRFNWCDEHPADKSGDDSRAKSNNKYKTHNIVLGRKRARFFSRRLFNEPFCAYDRNALYF